MQNLPTAYSTLYELSTVPKEAFEKAIADKTINPTMTRKQAAALAGSPDLPSKTPKTAPRDTLFANLEHEITELKSAVSQDQIKVDAEFTQSVKKAIKELQSLISPKSKNDWGQS